MVVKNGNIYLFIPNLSMQIVMMASELLDVNISLKAREAKGKKVIFDVKPL